MSDPMSEIDRIRAEYEDREANLPADLYAWHREEIQFWQASVARVCARLLRESGALPIDQASILDVGCGAGNWLLEFVQWGADPARLQGIDLLENRIEKARARLPSADLRCADAGHLPWPSQSFDLVTQFTVFSSILDPALRARMAAEMVRVLRPGGRIFWYDCRVSNPRRAAVRGLSEKAVRELFPGCKVRLARTTLAPPVSRAVARHSWALAMALEGVRLACTHLAGVISRE